MSIFSNKEKADYTRTLQKGISFVRSLRGGMTDDTGSREENIERLKNEMENADAIVIGAGAGLGACACVVKGKDFGTSFYRFGNSGKKRRYGQKKCDLQSSGRSDHDCLWRRETGDRTVWSSLL